MKYKATLILGPTGSGKTPLGNLIEQTHSNNFKYHHFDFGENLRAVSNNTQQSNFFFLI